MNESQADYVEHICPDCKAERADYEGPSKHLATCPNCGSASIPVEPQAAAPRWVVVGPEKDENKRDQWWRLERKGFPYGESGLKQLGDPFGNFLSKRWAQQTADYVNELELAALAAQADASALQTKLEDQLSAERTANLQMASALAAAQADAGALAVAVEALETIVAANAPTSRELMLIYYNIAQQALDRIKEGK